MKRSLHNLIIEIIEEYFDSLLNHLDYEVQHDRFVATFTDGIVVVIPSLLIIKEIEGLMRT